MPSKLQTYMQMADKAQRQITGSYRGWTGFLTTPQGCTNTPTPSRS